MHTRIDVYKRGNNTIYVPKVKRWYGWATFSTSINSFGDIGDAEFDTETGAAAFITEELDAREEYRLVKSIPFSK